MAEIYGHSTEWLGSSDFSLYHLQPTVYYYGYVGSITVPPCTNYVVWRFLDLPMQISHDQYVRVQKVLLDQKNENCRRSTKAHMGGVNRPISPNKHRVWHCDGRKWRTRFPELFCDKWPKNYHAAYRLRGICPGF